MKLISLLATTLLLLQLCSANNSGDCFGDNESKTDSGCECDDGYDYDTNNVCVKADCPKNGKCPHGDINTFGAAASTCVDGIKLDGQYECTCSDDFYLKDNVCFMISSCEWKCNTDGDDFAKCSKGEDDMCKCSEGFYSQGDVCKKEDCTFKTEGIRVLNHCTGSGDWHAECEDGTPRDGEYECRCNSGFVFKDGTCRHIGCDSSRPCSENGDYGAECIDEPGDGNYSCSCSSGWTEKLGTCQKNSCEPNRCIEKGDNSAKCIGGEAGDGTWSCECSPGWTDTDGVCKKKSCQDSNCASNGDALAFCEDGGENERKCSCSDSYVEKTYSSGSTCLSKNCFTDASYTSLVCSRAGDKKAQCDDPAPGDTEFDCMCSKGFQAVGRICYRIRQG